VITKLCVQSATVITKLCVQSATVIRKLKDNERTQISGGGI
jgi:hypothetical protein